VGTRLTGLWSRYRRGVAITAGLVATGGLAVVTLQAVATPPPTVAQVQAKVNQLTTQFDKVSEQLDQASQQLGSAQSRLKQVQVKYQHANAAFVAARTAMAQIAASAFEDSGAMSIAGVLTTGTADEILQQGSILEQLSANREGQTQQLLADASQLKGVQEEMQRTENGIAALKHELSDRKSSLKKLLTSEQAVLASLTVPQQQQVQKTTIGGQGSTTKTQYTGPTGTQADAAVSFEYSAIGCPYVYGGTGPCQYGYDCSGLAQAAWSSAGVAIPRDTYEQWAALPHIDASAIAPGDLLYYNGESHVAMYVGNGKIIDAPVPGADVELIPMNSQWYAANFDGAVRP
jgi:peptidoglycan DL-endopeptidase CwlO